LGGATNLLEVEACALTRVRVVLRDPGAADERALEGAGVAGVWRLGDGVVHLIVGEDAAGLAVALAEVGSVPRSARNQQPTRPVTRP
jgi:PTS system glucose-specific IIC component